MIDWRALLEEHPDVIHPILAGKARDRRVILRWRAFVLATHRDRSTVAYLNRAVWTGRVYPIDLDTATRLDAALAERC